jgi:hypothetical protein
MSILIEGPDVLGYSPTVYITTTNYTAASYGKAGPTVQNNGRAGREAASLMDQFVGMIGPMVVYYSPAAWVREVCG